MPQYHVKHQCNGSAVQNTDSVELANFTEAGAYALSTAPLFHDLVPGERRECAIQLREGSEGWLLKIELALCLEAPEPSTDDIDGGLLE